MEQSYLIQRLQKPFKPNTDPMMASLSNAFSFGGGLKDGGMSKEAMELIRSIFRFDYMGSSEFEWGAVPKAIAKIAKEQGGYVATTIEVDAQEPAYFARKRGQKPKTGKATIYILCRLDWITEVAARVSKWAKEEPYGETKESVMLQNAIFNNDRYDKEYGGWLELDNGFFFFTDKEMFEKTRDLFGIIEYAELAK
jgi:hypothetical protein